MLAAQNQHLMQTFEGMYIITEGGTAVESVAASTYERGLSLVLAVLCCEKRLGHRETFNFIFELSKPPGSKICVKVLFLEYS